MSYGELLTEADHDARALAMDCERLEDERDRLAAENAALRAAMPDAGMLERAARDLDPPRTFGVNDSEPNITSGNLRSAAAAIRAMSTPTHPHPTPPPARDPAFAQPVVDQMARRVQGRVPPPAADTVAPVAVAATPAATDDFQATDPTMAVDPLDALIFAMHPMYDHGRNLNMTMIALKRVQDVIEAALEMADALPDDDPLVEVVAAYRNWRPAPATVTSGDSGGASGGDGE